MLTLTSQIISTKQCLHLPKTAPSNKVDHLNPFIKTALDFFFKYLRYFQISWERPLDFMALPKVGITIQKEKRLNNKHYKDITDFPNSNEGNTPVNVILHNPALMS